MAGGLQASEQLPEQVNELLRPAKLNQSKCKPTTPYLLAPWSGDVSLQGWTNIQTFFSLFCGVLTIGILCCRACTVPLLSCIVSM